MRTFIVIAALGLVSIFAYSAQADRKEIVIPAVDLATEAQRDLKPIAGKWWLKKDAKEWGAPDGTILMTGQAAGKEGSSGEWQVTPANRFVPYRVPALEIDPKAKGWYRIHVGVYNEPVDPYSRILARLSGEPYPEYVQAPQETKARIAEVYWRAADLTGKKIRLEQPTAPMQHPGYGMLAGITHVRLVPMKAAEVTAAKKEIELPPLRQRLFGMLDTTDEIFWWGTAESEDDIRAIVYRHGQAGFGRIYWRCFGSHLDSSLDVPEASARWTEADEKRWCQAQK